MKLTLITTTINVPRVLELYRAIGPEVEIIVAGDLKTPDAETRDLLRRIDARYLGPAEQESMGTRSSEIIGWNSVQRRNLALLAAIRSRPEAIVTVDDDNIPISEQYFQDFTRLLSGPFHGVRAAASSGWYDVGHLFSPSISHRGFPPRLRHSDLGLRFEPTVGARVGVAAGLWLGDPDVDSMSRLVAKPEVHGVSTLFEGGLVVTPGVFTPFNSQNTGFRADLACLMMVWPGTGRYDDIWASYFAERVMMTSGDHVHFGKPYVWQERNKHDLLADVREEMLGAQHTEQYIQDLLAIDVGSGSILDKARRLHRNLAKKTYIPDVMKRLGEAWCDDVEYALS